MSRWHDNLGVWQGWCARGGTIAEQKRRLEQVPEHLREAVQGHLRTVHAVAWQGYVLAGRSKAQRRVRLDEVPASLRAPIERRLQNRERS